MSRFGANLWNGPFPTGVPMLASRTRQPAAARTATGPAEKSEAPWYRVENDASGELTVYLYGIVGGDWFDEGVTVSALRDEIDEFTGHTIHARINSPGGSVFEGYAVANALLSHPANVTVHVDGLAASIASVIACAGDKVIMAKQSMMMIHEASGMAWGNSGDMRQLADVLDKISSNIAGAYADKAGGDVAEWRDRMKAETWMTGAEAVELGLADEVANAQPTDAEPAEDVAAKAPEHLYRFKSRTAAPAPVPLPTRDRQLAAHAHTHLIDVEALRASVETDAGPSAVLVPAEIDAEAFRRALKGG